MTRALSIVTGIVLALISACETEAAEYCTTQLASVPATAKEQEYRDPPWWRPEAHPLVTDVASLGLRIELDSNAMRIIGADGSISNLPVPMSGIDYMGWNNLLVLPNGWFYGVGAQYDSAFKLEHADGQWRMAENISIRDYDLSWWQTLFPGWGRREAELKKEHHISRVVAKIGARGVSPALGAILFLGDQEKLVDGVFSPIPGPGMRRYYGDVTTSGTALMSDAYGHLFSYDGRTVEQLDGPAIAPGDWGWMNRPIESERTFVDGGGRLYEIRGTRHGELALVELVPEDRFDPGWFHAVTMPDGTLAIVRRHGIYEIVADGLRPIWSPPQGQYVVGPARANRLTDSGLVVTVGDEELRTTADWLLARCATAKGLK